MAFVSANVLLFCFILVNLRNNHLNGTIPSQFLMLPNLKRTSEYFVIYSEFKFEKIIVLITFLFAYYHYIDLENNLMTGMIPSEVANNSKLEWCKFSFSDTNDF